MSPIMVTLTSRCDFDFDRLVISFSENKNAPLTKIWKPFEKSHILYQKSPIGKMFKRSPLLVKDPGSVL